MIFEWVAVHFSRDVTAVHRVQIFEVVQDLRIESGSRMLNNPTGKQRIYHVLQTRTNQCPLGLPVASPAKYSGGKRGRRAETQDKQVVPLVIINEHTLTLR